MECKFTSRGARLIEVNCRMGGGPVRDTNLLVWGVDLVEEHLMAFAGERRRARRRREGGEGRGEGGGEGGREG